MSNGESTASRRAVLGGASGAAALVAIGGCSTYGGSSGAQPPPQPVPATSAGQPPAGGGTALAKVSDIPVGGGKIFTAEKVVVTQPAQGTIKAFSIVCTHQGCNVEEVEEGTINCPCHGSRFRIADGSVAKGPATSPLPLVAVSVSGDAITLG